VRRRFKEVLWESIESAKKGFKRREGQDEQCRDTEKEITGPGGPKRRKEPRRKEMPKKRCSISRGEESSRKETSARWVQNSYQTCLRGQREKREGKGQT